MKLKIDSKNFTSIILYDSENNPIKSQIISYYQKCYNGNLTIRRQNEIVIARAKAKWISCGNRGKYTVGPTSLPLKMEKIAKLETNSSEIWQQYIKKMEYTVKKNRFKNYFYLKGGSTINSLLKTAKFIKNKTFGNKENEIIFDHNKRLEKKYQLKYVYASWVNFLSKNRYKALAIFSFLLVLLLAYYLFILKINAKVNVKALAEGQKKVENLLTSKRRKRLPPNSEIENKTSFEALNKEASRAIENFGSKKRKFFPKKDKQNEAVDDLKDYEIFKVGRRAPDGSVAIIFNKKKRKFYGSLSKIAKNSISILRNLLNLKKNE